jgi:hypothetical protein
LLLVNDRAEAAGDPAKAPPTAPRLYTTFAIRSAVATARHLAAGIPVRHRLQSGRTGGCAIAGASVAAPSEAT